MNAKITFPEIVDLIAESTSTTKRVCELFLRELFATVSQSLIDGEDVKIKGVGTFKVTYTGKQVQNTNVRLSKVKDTIRYDWSSFLNYVY